jgi:hypothetical protein
VIARDAVTLLVPHFINPKIGAVAGNAKVGNRVNLWTRWQALEYITSQNFERRALNTLGAVSVVPGAIGAWRISAVREAGAFHTDTVAEDADLTMALLRNGYRVEYEDMALAYTEAPVKANGLMRQRFRWSFGILQAVYKHRAGLARKGALGWVALPNIIIFQILLPLVSPFIDLMFIGGALWYFGQKYFHPESTDPATQALTHVISLRELVMAGQYLDVLVQARGEFSAEDAVRVVQFKTSKYTVEGPLHLGAAAAGADEAVFAALTGYGLALGEAFQLRDDVLGIFGDPSVTGKPAGDDLREGKRTLLVALAVAGATAPDAEMLRSRFGQRDMADATVAQLRAVIESSGALAQVEQRITQRAAGARDALDSPALSPASRAALYALAVAATERIT